MYKFIYLKKLSKILFIYLHHKRSKQWSMQKIATRVVTRNIHASRA